MFEFGAFVLLKSPDMDVSPGPIFAVNCKKGLAGTWFDAAIAPNVGPAAA
jgi:hypothetical protein